jgi:hypothetical protein
MSDDFREYAKFKKVGPSRHLTAQLSHRGAQWVLCVYIEVEFIFDVSYAAQLKGAKDWTEDEEEAWKEAFIKSGEATFSYRYSLQALVSRGDVSLRGPLLVDVEVAIVEVDPSKMTHTGDVFKVFVTREPLQGAREMEGTSRPEIQVTEGHIGMHKTSHAPDWLLQKGTDHEIGHALGMAHPRCKETELYCYGDPNDASGQDLMGMGQRVSERDYEVFAKILEEIAPGRRWIVVGNGFTPTPERQPSWLIKPGPHPTHVPGPTGHGKTTVKRRHRTRSH